MGLFWNRNKDKKPPATPEMQEPQATEKPVQPTFASGVPKAPPQPQQQSQPEQQKEPVEVKPSNEIEMRKVVFRFSTRDQEKCSAYIKEMIRRLNRHDWHNLSGRIGKNLDKVKMRMDIKGKTEDIDAFIKWCKTDHFGVHIYEVVESKAFRMPYPTTFPPFQELQGSWPGA